MGGWRLFWHYTVEKTLAFAPGHGAAAITCEGYVGCDLTVLTATVVGGYFVSIQTALAGFPAASLDEKDAGPWLGRMAFARWAVLKALKWAWRVFTGSSVPGCLLSLNDTSTAWN